jgi:hypothetical protein
MKAKGRQLSLAAFCLKRLNGAASPEYHPESPAMYSYWQVKKTHLPP